MSRTFVIARHAVPVLASAAIALSAAGSSVRAAPAPCAVQATRTAEPRVVPEGGMVTVSLDVAWDCAAVDTPLALVLVVGGFGGPGHGNEGAVVRGAMIELLRRAGLEDGGRAAVIVVGDTRRAPLLSGGADGLRALEQAVAAIESVPPPEALDLARAVERAQETLGGAPSTLRPAVIVLNGTGPRNAALGSPGDAAIAGAMTALRASVSVAAIGVRPGSGVMIGTIPNAIGRNVSAFPDALRWQVERASGAELPAMVDEVADLLRGSRADGWQVREQLAQVDGRRRSIFAPEINGMVPPASRYDPFTQELRWQLASTAEDPGSLRITYRLQAVAGSAGGAGRITPISAAPFGSTHGMTFLSPVFELRRAGRLLGQWGLPNPEVCIHRPGSAAEDCGEIARGPATPIPTSPAPPLTVAPPAATASASSPPPTSAAATPTAPGTPATATPADSADPSLLLPFASVPQP